MPEPADSEVTEVFKMQEETKRLQKARDRLARTERRVHMRRAEDSRWRAERKRERERNEFLEKRRRWNGERVVRLAKKKTTKEVCDATGNVFLVET